MRKVAWDGKPAEPPHEVGIRESGIRAVPHKKPGATVNAAFLGVAWLGQKPPPATYVQSAKSVRAILANLDFDKGIQK